MKKSKIITFGDWAAFWLDSVKGSVKDNSFYSTYFNTVNNHLNPVFRDVKIDSITQIDIQKFITETEITAISADKSAEIKLLVEPIEDNASSLIESEQNSRLYSSLINDII